MKIVMVCLGNICRSPLAEGLLSKKTSNISNILVDSAGLINYHQGNAPHKDSIKVARQNGVDIRQQKSRQICKEDFLTFDRIYAMDQSVYQELLRLSPEIHHPKIKLILSEQFDEPKDVKDPYGMAFSAYQEMYQVLDEVTDIIAKKIQL